MDMYRFEEQVKVLEREEIGYNKILLYGNSYFAFWRTNIEEHFKDFLGENVIFSRGFGGATSAELLFYYDRLVKPCNPKALLWTEGANDFEQGFSVKDAVSNAYAAFDKALSDGINLIILSSIETPKSYITGIIQSSQEYSLRVQEYALKNNCAYIDIAPFFYLPKQKKTIENFRSDIFTEDSVHLNEVGYVYFATFLKNEFVANKLALV